MSPRPRWPRRRRAIEVAVTTSPRRLGLCRAALRGLMDTFAPEGGAGLPVPCRPMESLDLIPLRLSFGLVHILAVAAAAAVNEELRRSRRLDTVNSGCTALSIVKQGDLMVVANVGDSRAVLATMSGDGDVTAVQLTVHFKPDLPHEKGLNLGVDWGITFSSGLGVQVLILVSIAASCLRRLQLVTCFLGVQAFSNRAQFHIFLGALPEDFEDAEKCIELDPNFLLGYVCQAKVQALRCSDESARATYIEALEPVVIDGLNRCLTCIKRSEGRYVGPDNLNDILVIIFLCDKSSMVTFKQAQSQELQMAPRKPQWFLAAMSIRQGRLPREAELVPNADDRVLELEIISKLTGRCAEAKRRLSLALEAFPCDLHQQLDQFMSGRSCETMASSSVQSSCVAI